MAYNSQIAVDDKYKFIVATDISTNGHDLDQLHNMATKDKKCKILQKPIYLQS
jgi:hypothetical protein